MNFEFATANRIVFGPGTRTQALAAAREMGSCALLITRHAERFSFSGMDTVAFSVTGEPTVNLVRHGVELARKQQCDVVISIGGGSVIDAGKAIAALLTNPGDVMDYLEVVGKGKPISQPAAPFIAIPTTAGTGAEVTRNAVLASEEHGVKASLRSPYLLPRLAIVDPELTLELPPNVTAYTGLDALTQVIEPYVSVRSNAFTDLFCVKGMTRAARSLGRAFTHGEDIAARTDMCIVSLLGGLALANAGLGAVHAFAAPIGGRYPAPHGAVCAAFLPHVTEANIRALRARAPQGEALRRYEYIAQILTGKADARPEDAAAWLLELTTWLQIPALRTYGVQSTDAAAIIKDAARASSMKGNPIELFPDELDWILARAI